MSITVLLQLGVELGDFWVLDGGLEGGVELLSAGSVGGGPLLFELSADLGVVPADLGANVTEDAELGGRLEAELSHGLWDEDVAGGVLLWDAGEGLEVGEGSLAADGLVGAHTTDGLADDLGWVVEMEWTALVVEVGALLEVLHVVGLGTELGAGDVDLLAVDDDDLLAVQELLGDDGAETTEQVVAGVDDDGLPHFRRRGGSKQNEIIRHEVAIVRVYSCGRNIVTTPQSSNSTNKIMLCCFVAASKSDLM